MGVGSHVGHLNAISRKEPFPNLSPTWPLGHRHKRVGQLAKLAAFHSFPSKTHTLWFNLVAIFYLCGQLAILKAAKTANWPTLPLRGIVAILLAIFT